ncbi:MAG: hypothetical protein ACKOUM_05990 [Sphingopyxis sp.]
MQKFTVGEAWSQSIDVLQNNIGPLLLYAGGGAFLGAFVQVGIFGFNPADFSNQLQQGAASKNLTAILSAMVPLLFGGLGAAVVSSTGQLAAMRTILAPDDDESTGSILGYSVVGALLSLLVFGAIALVALGVVGMVLGLLGAGAVIGAGAGSSGGAAAAAGILLLAMVVILPLLIWFGARCWVILPAMAHARSTNPLYGFAQSWRLSRDHQLSLIGFMLILGVVVIVISGVIGLVGGALSAMLGSGQIAVFLSTVLTGVPQAVVGVGVSIGVFRALIPVDDGAVFS